MSMWAHLSGPILLTPVLDVADAPEICSASLSRVCALIMMTNSERIQAAIENQDNRILSRCACFSLPRRRDQCKLARRKKWHLWRCRHGVVRAIEGLRRMWLSMVPGPNRGDCLLQGV